MSLQAVKGTRDILPDETPAWQRVEDAAHRLFRRYGYREIRTPILEVTELFARSIGTDTDIVSKEMYTFTDRDEKQTSLTLRPEATAGLVRAVIEHNLIQSDPALKLYSIGPMFRREQPQKGRYRQFHQVDVEAFGMNEPSVDVEVIDMALQYLKACGLSAYDLVLNSVGDEKCRPAYVETLRSELRKHAARLCADCQRRSETNPLRVLDCKVPEDQAIIDALPRIVDHLCSECRDHFDEVKQELGILEIPYRESHRLVRGLDYYVRTTFEVTSGALGAQNSVLGGGRYDGLVKALGGPDIAGTGFALGMERLVMLLTQEQEPEPERPKRCDVFLAPLVEDPAARRIVLRLQKDLRANEVSVLRAREARSLKAQMKQANKLRASFVAILGADELKSGEWMIRDMQSSTQELVKQSDALEYLRKYLRNQLAHG